MSFNVPFPSWRSRSVSAAGGEGRARPWECPEPGPRGGFPAGSGQGCASEVAAPELMPWKVRAENPETADFGLVAFLKYLTTWFEGKTQSAAVTQGAPAWLLTRP